VARREAFSKICRHVCQTQGWELLPTGLVVRWGDGRHQLVSIEFFEFEREQLLRLSSLIGPVASLDAVRFERILHTNAELAHGALAIRNDELCMVDTLPLAAAEEPILTATVEYLARTADEYERLLYREDIH